jgi:hypothetical protein
LLYVVVGLSKTFISFCCRFFECFFLLVGLHLKPLNIKISQVNERVRSLKNCRGVAGKLKCRFEVWVQGRKVESWMQV